MKRRIYISIMSIAILALMLPAIAHAADLPIDPETITGQRDPQQEALTARHGIDLFSETADEITGRLDMQREEKLAAAQETLFNEPFELQANVPETQIQQAVGEAGLFVAPMRFESNVQHEIDDSGIPLWIIILTIIAASVLGIAIAKVSKSVEKKNVHNHNN